MQQVSIDTATINGGDSDTKCLQCGQTRRAVIAGADGYALACVIVGGHEYVEVTDQWEEHRWHDWSNHELATRGVKSEVYDKYRRLQEPDFEYVDCEDQISGHSPLTEPDECYGDLNVGDCVACWKPAAG